MSHTPGPWRSLDEQYPFDDHYRVAGPDNPLPDGASWQADNRPIVAICGKPDDARLIAASPSMYEALKALTENIGNVGAHDCPGFDCNRCQAPGVGWSLAYEAIAKAEGRET